jgi:hypothetical protein
VPLGEGPPALLGLPNDPDMVIFDEDPEGAVEEEAESARDPRRPPEYLSPAIGRGWPRAGPDQAEGRAGAIPRLENEPEPGVPGAMEGADISGRGPVMLPCCLGGPGRGAEPGPARGEFAGPPAAPLA